MFHLLKHISTHSKGIFALILGAVLILGTLGKLQILQGILNSVMIFTGAVLIFWGLQEAKGFHALSKLLGRKK